MKEQRVMIVGVGGIGSWLADEVACYLAALKRPEIKYYLLLLDGKTIRPENLTRQSFRYSGNKARSKQRELAEKHPDLRIDVTEDYLKPDNLEFQVDEGDIILLCVDNHATRKFVSDAAKNYQGLTIISGGNEMVYGTVQIYQRREGRDVLPPLTQGHPEIAEPQDRPPYELGCEELIQAGQTQTLRANVMAASIMLNALGRVIEKPETVVEELIGSVIKLDTACSEFYFDVHRNRVQGQKVSVRSDAHGERSGPEASSGEKGAVV